MPLTAETVESDRHPPRLRLNMLGRFDLRGPGSAEVTSKKNRALLAILALSPGGEATREKICGLLWGERGEEQARQSLRQSLAVLRKELGPDLADVLRSRDDTVGLQLDRSEVDALSFLAIPANSTLENLSKAAELYASELLADLALREAGFDDWLAAQRRRLTGHAIAVFEGLAVMCDNPARLDHGRRLIDLDPLRESSHRALMQAYSDSGENGLALKQYEVCAKLLQEELQAEPAPATQDLRRKLLQDVPSSKPAPHVALEPNEPRSRRAAVSPAIVVVPFRCPGGDADQQVFADGISDDLARELRRFNEIRVVRATPFSTLLKEERVFELSGSVRRSGNQMRVTVQLTALDSGQLLWSEKYDRDASEIFSVQDDIVGACIYNLVDSVNQSTLAELRKSRPRNLTAYEHFIEGRASFYLLSRSSVETANQRLRSAIACEPGFAAAHAWLAETCWLSWWAGWCGAGNASLLDARDHARSAVELDAREAQGFAELGQALLFLGEPEQARTAIRKAMTLNPHDPDVITIAAFEQLYQGDTAAADAVIREAIRYDPNGHYGLVQSLIHMANEQWREALSTLLTVRAKIPEVEAWLAAAMAMCGRPEAARDAALRYANARETPPPGFDAIGWIMHRHPFASDKHDRTIRAALAAAGLAETQGGSER